MQGNPESSRKRSGSEALVSPSPKIRRSNDKRGNDLEQARVQAMSSLERMTEVEEVHWKVCHLQLLGSLLINVSSETLLISEWYSLMGFILWVEKARVAAAVDLDARLQAAEQQKEQALGKIRELEEQLSLSEASKAKSDVEIALLRALRKDRAEFISKIIGHILSFEEKLMDELVYARLKISMAYRASPSSRFHKELSYDNARLDRFSACIGQLINKGLLLKGIVPQKVGILSTLNADGTKSSLEGVTDEELEGCEFAEIVTAGIVPNGVKFKVTHNGPLSALLRADMLEKICSLLHGTVTRIFMGDVLPCRSLWMVTLRITTSMRNCMSIG